MNSDTPKHIVTGVAGCLAAVTLSDVNVIAGIAAAAMTAIYMGVCTYFKIKKHLSDE